MIPVKKYAPQAIRPFLKTLRGIPLLTRLLGRFSILGSQAGQDFWVFGEAFNEQKGGYFLDIGAHDGINISNTYILESHYKWSGICVEANPHTFKKLAKNRRSTCVNVCVDDSVGFVDFALRDGLGGIIGHDLGNKQDEASVDVIEKLATILLTDLLNQYDAPKIIDYVSIDVEGAEERVLANFDFDRYLFRTMTIERPTKRLREILHSHGYLLIKEIPNLDCFYVHQKFLKEYKRNLFKFYNQKRCKIYWK